MADKPANQPPNQAAKFKEAARALECDEDEGRWDERLKAVAKGPRKHIGTRGG